MLFLIHILSFFSCKNENGLNNQNFNSSKASFLLSDSTLHCYVWTNKMDSIELQFAIYQSSAEITLVNGFLFYKFFEKDRSEGDISGIIKQDTLFATYHFMSEGILSTAEHVFLIKESSVWEGYGEKEIKNGKEVFKNISQISFDSTAALQKVSCEM